MLEPPMPVPNVGVRVDDTGIASIEQLEQLLLLGTLMAIFVIHLDPIKCLAGWEGVGRRSQSRRWMCMPVCLAGQ
jgi:hypothetical protein